MGSEMSLEEEGDSTRRKRPKKEEDVDDPRTALTRMKRGPDHVNDDDDDHDAPSTTTTSTTGIKPEHHDGSIISSSGGATSNTKKRHRTGNGKENAGGGGGGSGSLMASCLSHSSNTAATTAGDAAAQQQHHHLLLSPSEVMELCWLDNDGNGVGVPDEMDPSIVFHNGVCMTYNSNNSADAERKSITVRPGDVVRLMWRSAVTTIKEEEEQADPPLCIKQEEDSGAVLTSHHPKEWQETERFCRVQALWEEQARGNGSGSRVDKREPRVAKFRGQWLYTRKEIMIAKTNHDRLNLTSSCSSGGGDVDDDKKKEDLLLDRRIAMLGPRELVLSDNDECQILDIRTIQGVVPVAFYQPPIRLVQQKNQDVVVVVEEEVNNPIIPPWLCRYSFKTEDDYWELRAVNEVFNNNNFNSNGHPLLLTADMSANDDIRATNSSSGSSSSSSVVDSDWKVDHCWLDAGTIDPKKDPTVVFHSAVRLTCGGQCHTIQLGDTVRLWSSSDDDDDDEGNNNNNGRNALIKQEESSSCHSHQQQHSWQAQWFCLVQELWEKAAAANDNGIRRRSNKEPAVQFRGQWFYTKDCIAEEFKDSRRTKKLLQRMLPNELLLSDATEVNDLACIQGLVPVAFHEPRPGESTTNPPPEPWLCRYILETVHEGWKLVEWSKQSYFDRGGGGGGGPAPVVSKSSAAYGPSPKVVFQEQLQKVESELQELQDQVKNKKVERRRLRKLIQRLG